MSDLETWIWIAVGLATGAVHAGMLWRTARRPNGWSAVWGMLRLLTVAAVLSAAAVWGNLLAAAAGWAGGLVSIGAWLLVGSPKPSHSSSRVESRE